MSRKNYRKRRYKTKSMRKKQKRLLSIVAALMVVLVAAIGGDYSLDDSLFSPLSEIISQETGGAFDDFLKIGEADETNGELQQENSPQQENEASDTKYMDATGDVDETQEQIQVTFLDVGQGNAVLVEQGGHYALIDGGDRDKSSYVVSYLQQHNIKTLDYVIVSHYDDDHLNGAVGALHVFNCQQVIAPNYTTDSRVYRSFCDVIKEKNIPVIYPKIGDHFLLGDAQITVVSPSNYEHKKENDNSVGVKITFKNRSFLMLGDLEEDGEKEILSKNVDLAADVYLASHHGSKNASSLALLKAVQPEIAVISVGADNSYGHPAQETLMRFSEIGAKVYRTDRQGIITCVSDGDKIKVSTEK